QGAVAGSPVTLTAAVVDDGLPKPRAAPAAKAATSSSFAGQANSSGGAPRLAGLTVSWMQYGGPAKVRFETAGPIAVTNGRAVTAATFTAPGTYQFVVSATDRAMTTREPVTVTVRAPAN
ncbi:MAG TPA: hypothetical protein VNZ24_10530, partial [Vicinamibacterales bacterium]|nr:hypothetical protein [Vicinamibacterales bacterium]